MHTHTTKLVVLLACIHGHTWGSACMMRGCCFAVHVSAAHDGGAVQATRGSGGNDRGGGGGGKGGGSKGRRGGGAGQQRRRCMMASVKGAEPAQLTAQPPSIVGLAM